MRSSLRILQITLIIAQITTVKGSSTLTTPATTVKASTTVALASPSVTEAQTTALPNTRVTTSPLVTSITSSVYNSTGQAELTNNPVPSSNQQSTTASGDSSTVAINVSSATSSAANSSSTSLNSSVTLSPGNSLELNSASSLSGNATKSGSLTISNTTSTKPATSTNNVPVNSPTTAATSLSSHSGLLTSPTQFITANYSLSLPSRRGSIVSTTAEPKNMLTTSLPVSVNWTDWSVDSTDCQNYCSEKGGTVTAKRHCYSHTITLDENVCTKHDNSTKVVNCDDDQACPISGKETFGSSISTLAVSILLVMLSSTFTRD